MPDKKTANSGCADTVHCLHGDKTSSFSPGFDRNNHRSFSFGTTASFAGTFAADNRIVQLDQVGEQVDAVPVGHSSSDLAQHVAGRDPRDAQMLGYSKRGNAIFVRSHEIDGPEPFDQGLDGGIEHIDTGVARQHDRLSRHHMRGTENHWANEF